MSFCADYKAAHYLAVEKMREVDVEHMKRSGNRSIFDANGAVPGSLYEQYLAASFDELGIVFDFKKHLACVDFNLVDHEALSQVKVTKGKGYTFGKTGKNNRKDATDAAEGTILQRFSDFPDAKNLYVCLWDYEDDVVHIYRLAKRKNGKVIIDDFLRDQANGFKPESKVNVELTYTTSVLNEIYRFSKSLDGLEEAERYLKKSELAPMLSQKSP